MTVALSRYSFLQGQQLVLTVLRKYKYKWMEKDDLELLYLVSFALTHAVRLHCFKLKNQTRYNTDRQRLVRVGTFGSSISSYYSYFWKTVFIL